MIKIYPYVPILTSLSLGPFILSDAGILPDKSTIIVLLAAVFFLVITNARLVINEHRLAMIVCLFVQIIFSLAMFQYGVVETIVLPLSLFSVLLLYLFVISSKVNSVDIAKITVYFIVTISVCAMISSILTFLNYFTPIPVFERSATETIYFSGLTFTNTIIPVGPFLLIRPSGLFMETGVLGLYIILSLLLNHLTEDNRKVEVLLIVSGLFTLSLGFYVSLIVYVIYRVISIEKSSLKNNAIIAGVLIMTFAALYLLTFYRDLPFIAYLYDLSLGRFVPKEGVGITGATGRMADTKLGLLYLSEAPFFGHGMAAIQSVNASIHASIGGYLAEYGVIGGTIFMLHILILCFYALLSRKRKQSYFPSIAAFIILINLFHRPFVNQYLYYLFIFLIFESFFVKRYRLSVADNNIIIRQYN